MGFNDLRKKNLSSSQGQAAGIPAEFEGPLSTFGEVSTSQLSPVAQGDFVYNNINNQIFNDTSFAGGSVAVNDGMAELISGTDPSGSAVIQLRRGLKYRPGQGSLMRATALFGEPEPGNAQFIGLGNSEGGYFVGYFGGFFGILHSSDGSREIRKLTITAGAGTENVDIQLDGDTISISVVGGGDITQTAYQIALGDYSQVGNGGWLADAIGDSVYFLSARSGPASGAYSLSSAGTAAGTFTQVKVGEAQTNDFVTSGSFNIDKLDGSGPSEMILDPQMGNVFQIGFQYLGFGNAKFSIENPINGFMTPFHEIRNANSRTTPVLKNPNASVLATSSNIGGTTSSTLKTVSMSAFTEGIVKKLDPKFALSTSFININQPTYRPLMILKANRVFNGQSSFGEFDLLQLAASNEVNNKTLTVGLFLDKEVTGDVDFKYVNEDSSIVSYAIVSPSTQTIVAPVGLPFYELVVGSASSKTIDLAMMDFVFGPGTNLIIAIKTTANMAGQVSVNWFEQQ
jgi:hypothetical protein